MPLNLERAQLEKLVEISSRFSQVGDLGTTLQEFADAAAELTQSDGSSILLFEEETQQLYFAAACANDRENLLSIRVPVERSVAGRVFNESIPLLIMNAKTDTRIYRTIEKTTQFSTRNLIAYPIKFGEEAYGTLEVINKIENQDYTQKDQIIIEILASYIATVLHIHQRSTEAAELSQGLRELEKEKSSFIAITSHELRTPLGLVLGHATFLKELVEDEFTQSQLEIIINNAERLKEIIEGLNQVENFDSGTMRMRWQNADLNELLLEVVDSFRSIAQELGIQLGVTVPNIPLQIQCDIAKLKVGLGNIVENGLIFSNRGQSVQVGLCKLSGYAHVSVADSGIGIAAENLHRIFDRFYQVEPHLTRTHGGMGLGLSVSKTIIESHGGHIWVESTLGEGSTFTVLLPIEETLEEP